MLNGDFSRADVARARTILDEARGLHSSAHFNLAVRRCQEAVELALKGALRHAGLDVPKVHDAGGILRRFAKRFPETFRAHIPALAAISRSLAGERATAFCGDAEAGIPPEELYDASDGEDALRRCETVVSRCEELVGAQ